MSLAGYTTAVERSARGDLNVWVEIEGLPYAYGTHARESSWFSSRAAGDRFEGIVKVEVRRATGQTRDNFVWIRRRITHPVKDGSVDRVTHHLHVDSGMLKPEMADDRSEEKEI
jgi:hypothetical protein